MDCNEAAEKVIDVLNTDFAILRTTKGYFLKYFIYDKNVLKENMEMNAKTLPELFKKITGKEVIFCAAAEALIEKLYDLLSGRCVSFEFRVWDGNIGPKEKGWSLWMVSPDGEMKFGEISRGKEFMAVVAGALDSFEKALAVYQQFSD